MNNKDKRCVLYTAQALLAMYKKHSIKGDSWYGHDARQVVVDTLECLKKTGLIEDYNLNEQTITMYSTVHNQTIGDW